MFGDMMFVKHTNSRPFQGPSQIVRQTISNLDMGISPYAQYHRYKGLSSIPNLAGNRKDIPDIKQSYIYKHPMRDMRIWGYKGLVDIKVWI